MTAASLTDEQTLALRTRDTSIALAAGAGCGKTFVLSERFLSHLERDRERALDPAQLHQLIAITFTDAAAREMRRRIRDKCFERSRTAETAESQDYWLRLLRAIEAARVSTIHAFCASLLREHALEAGLDPAFAVLDQGAADVLQSEVMDDVLRRRLAAMEATTLELTATYGLSRLKEQVRELLKHRHGEAFDAWRTATADEVVAKWRDAYESRVLPLTMAELAASPDIRVICELLHSLAPPKKERFATARAHLLEMLPRLERRELNAAELESLRENAVVQTVCSAKDWPNKEAFDAYRDACKRLRALLDKSAARPFSAEAAVPAAILGLQVLELVHDVAGEYERTKARQGKLDFDDLLAQAYRLLTDRHREPLRKRLSSELKLLLVDEFQDTDRLQVELVKVLCGDVADGKLFFVGDENQSIYRFRGAQPAVFLDLQAKVPKPGRLPLTLNFRSQPAILHFVNALFCEALGGKYRPLRPKREQITAEPAVEFLWTQTPDKRNRRLKGAARTARAEEARRIARRLRALIDSGEPIIADAHATSGKRPLKLGDAAILFRALSDVDLYEAALREYELDYYLVGGHAFYAQQEIYDVLNLLRAIASPADEISLAGVLRSPFFSLADETLYWLVESGGSLNDGLFGDTLPTGLSAGERIKAAAAAETLSTLRARKDSLPTAALLGEALARTGYDAALLGEFLGDRKLANLNKLMEQARTADTGDTLDLSGFIAQLAEFVVREPKEALAATLSETDDVVRLMTIHHAKGLEFPLVVVPDLDRRPEFRTPAAALDDQLGPVVSPAADDDENERPLAGIDLYRTIEKLADAEERKRLLYVATTRAADYLVLSSSLADFDESQLDSDWMKLLAERFNLTTGALRGELPAGYPRPQVRVVDSESVIEFKPSGGAWGPDLLAIVEEARDLAAGGGGVVPPDIGPIPPDIAARSQFSVSRLTGRIVRPDWHELVPSATPAAVDPRSLGTLVHAALQRLDLRGGNDIGRLCEQLAADLVMQNTAPAAELARDMLERFAASSRWSEIVAAKRVHRELEFLLSWPPDRTQGGGRYLQGFLDCLYQDSGGGWHVVDYKTNDVATGNVPSIAPQYEMQMLVYALAVERAVGESPAEVALHFLRPGIEHTFAWNDAARDRCAAMVERSLLEYSHSDA